MDLEILKLRVGRLRLQHGDILVVQSDRELSASTWGRINHVVRQCLPNHVKHIGLGPGIKLSVLTPVMLAEKLAETEL